MHQYGSAACKMTAPVLRISLLMALLMAVPISHAQDNVNPSLRIDPIRINADQFNVMARESAIILFDDMHSTSWQVTLDNNLAYEHPDGVAVARLYDGNRDNTFIEVGMGGPPDRTFWVAVQLPDEGYVPIYNTEARGWSDSSKTIVSYTDRAGLTVNNGARIVVTNLDIGVFAIHGYSVHGKQGSTDPRSVNSGEYVMEFLSGDPSQNIFSLYPFILTAAVGILVAVLFVTKRRPT